ncbi:MAG: ankyrin repeat domain-containing protein [Bacteroidota bacterium]
MSRIILFLCLLLPFYAAAQNAHKQLKKMIDKDDTKALEKFLGPEGDINTCYTINESAYSLLILSIKYDAPAIFAACLLRGAEIDQICDSKSPLMYAVKYDQMEMFQALLKQGADPSLETSNGKTAYDYALKYHRSTFIPLLSTPNDQP